MESAKLKLLAALPATSRADAQRISSKLHLDPVDWYRETQPVPRLDVVAEAVWSEQRLAMHHERWRGVGARTVDPLGLVLKAGTWYLVPGRRHRECAANLSGIEHRQCRSVAGVDRQPGKFDLAAYWVESIKRFERDLYTGEARLLATPGGLKGLCHISSTVAKAVAAAPPSWRKYGRVKVRVPIESIAHAIGQLLRLSPEVEVIAPDALRASVVARVRRIASLYGLDVTTRAG